MFKVFERFVENHFHQRIRITKMNLCLKEDIASVVPTKNISLSLRSSKGSLKSAAGIRSYVHQNFDAPTFTSTTEGADMEASGVKEFSPSFSVLFWDFPRRRS